MKKVRKYTDFKNPDNIILWGLAGFVAGILMIILQPILVYGGIIMTGVGVYLKYRKK